MVCHEFVVPSCAADSVLQGNALTDTCGGETSEDLKRLSLTALFSEVRNGLLEIDPLNLCIIRFLNAVEFVLIDKVPILTTHRN